MMGSKRMGHSNSEKLRIFDISRSTVSRLLSENADGMHYRPPWNLMIVKSSFKLQFSSGNRQTVAV